VNVGFLHIGNNTRLAEIMVASVRRVMPRSRIVHMADPKTPSIAGIDVRINSPQDIPIMVYRLRHLAGLGAGEWLILDTDVVVQRPLEGVLGEHDVCLTRREVCLDRDGNNVAEWMPYNTGVMWCRNPEFWRAAYKVCAKLPPKLQDWYGDQVAVRLAVESKRFKVREVSVDPWNYSPESENEDVSQKAAVHYKGKRKGWMLKWASQTTQT
jgi:hypothetical protein